MFLGIQMAVRLALQPYEMVRGIGPLGMPMDLSLKPADMTLGGNKVSGLSILTLDSPTEWKPMRTD